MKPWQLSATDAADRIASGTLTSAALVESCLERIAEREDAVQAWACLDEELALEQAHAADRATPRSRLHGIPVGVKDVLDTADLPTEYGSPIHRGYRPRCDAACVAQVREAGGVILGKTVTTEFATRHPGKTRNPHHQDHTPGGSSSGSAAAAADGMVPLAFGTQTSSSIIRPAAYCGAVGYKPSFGLVNRAGLKCLSDSIDVIGTLSRTIPDAALLVETLTGADPTSFDRVSRLHPRIGFCRTPWWNAADAPTRARLEEAAGRLAAAGATVRDVTLDGEFAALDRVQVEVTSYEFFRSLAWERLNHPELISAHLTKRIADGGKVSRATYEAAQALLARCRARITDVFRDHDVLLSPSAPGEAPTGLAATGEPIFGLMWSALHGPSVTIPAFRGPNGLPIGAQLNGAIGNDAWTLACAEWVSRTLQR